MARNPCCKTINDELMARTMTEAAIITSTMVNAQFADLRFGQNAKSEDVMDLGWMAVTSGYASRFMLA